MTCAIPKWVNEEFLLSKCVFAWNSSQGCRKASVSLFFELEFVEAKCSLSFFIIFSPGGVEMAACRWMQEGIPLFRHNMMWLRVRALRWLLARLSRPGLLLFASNLFLSLRLVSLILSAESRVHPHSQLLPGDCGWPALITVRVLALSPQSWVHLKHSSTPPSSFWLT